MRRFALASVAWAAPALASACPYCARASGDGFGYYLATAIMLTLPLGMAGALVLWLRRAARLRTAEMVGPQLNGEMP